MAIEYKLSYTGQQINEKLGKIDSAVQQTELTSAINSALSQAKASGEFDGADGFTPTITISQGQETDGRGNVTISVANEIDGEIVIEEAKVVDGKNGGNGQDGRRGTALLFITTAPTGYTTEVNGLKPLYRIELSIVKTEASTAEVFVGDTVSHSYNLYPIIYVDSFYVYFGKRVSIRGSAGKEGTSVTISSITASDESGGENVVTFSDDNTLTVKNGKDGISGSDGINGADGYTPIRGVDYYTEADKAELKNYISTELAKRGQLKPEYADSIEKCTDTSKMYVLPDGFIYAWMLTEKEVTTGATYNNLLDDAINSDKTPYVVTNSDGTTTVGYKKGWRINSSNVEKESSTNCMTGYIPVRSGQTIRIKNVTISTGTNGYFHWYKADFSPSISAYYENHDGDGYSTKPNADGLIEFNAPSVASIYYFRMTTGVITDETIITVNEEITEGGGTEIVTEYAWASTGHAFVPADYEGRIIDLEEQVAEHAANIAVQAEEIATLKKGVVDTGVDALTWIRNWDSPIYDANIPVFQLSTEKAAMTNATMTPDALYAMYDALMAKYPHYITKTDLGICSDGVNHVYRYDFKDPEQRHTNNRNSETKAKAILVSGIHLEWAGMFGLYYALEEITENPVLRDLRRNVHLVVIPCCNPFVTLVEHWDEHGGQQNANGVEVHRNFEAAFLYPDNPDYVPFGELHHGGTEPLSEVETQYIDNVLKKNTDAAFFVTCHNYNLDQEFGISFIWGSVATAYMCNMSYRLIDKMSDAWMDKYGDELAPGIESYRFDTVGSWDTRLGHAQISGSPGTETRQATKYGIQGANVEICERFHVHGTKENPEPLMSSFTMSRGAEVYINFLLTAFGVYDHKDKKEYAPAVVD